MGATRFTGSKKHPFEKRTEVDAPGSYCGIRQIQCALMGDRIRGYAHRVDIAGDVPAVWRAFTEGVHLVRWGAPDPRLRPQAGGLFRASVDRVTQLEAHIDVYDPNRRLRLIYLPS